MYAMSLAEIAEQLGYAYRGPDELFCSEVVIDSRKAQSDSLFIALAGKQSDGHQYLEQAIAQGATGLVVSQAACFEDRVGIGMVYAPEGGEVFLQDLSCWMRKSFQGPVIAVTGSQGKTSTKDLLAQILSEDFEIVATEENFNNDLGMPLTITRLTEETELLLLEMGMDRKGDIDFLSEIAQPTIGIITGIGLAHAEHLGSQEDIAAAKAEMFAHLPEAGKLYLRIKDQDLLGPMLKESLAPVVWCCIEEDCPEDFNGMQAEDLRLSVDSSEFTCSYGAATSFRVQIPMAGSHYVDNALLAIACARDLGVLAKDLKDRLPKVRVKSKNRMTYHLLSKGSLMINDAYNANPDSMRATIDVLAGYAPRTLVACLGDMKELGSYEKTAHRKLGRYVVEKNIDRLIAFGPLARMIAEAALEAGMDATHVLASEDLKACIDQLCDWELSDAVILVKGSRSMGMEAIVEGIRSCELRGDRA